MKWKFIAVESFKPSVFGLNVLFAVKVARWHGKSDVRGFYLKDWISIAEFLDYDPMTGKDLKIARWFIFCAIGE